MNGPAPEPDAGAGPESAAGSLRHAEHLIAIRRYADALPWAARAIAAEPGRSRGHGLLALARLGLGRYADALDAAMRGAAADPWDEWPHRLRSIILLAMGRRAAALAAARVAARLAPDVPETLYTLVQAQLACAKRRDADATADRLRSAAPDNVLTHRALAHAAVARKNWKTAEGHLRLALAVEPESYDALNDLGRALAEQGREREALARFHDALRVRPGRGEAQDGLFAALRRFLRPGWMIPVGVLVGASVRALPHGDAALPLAFGAVIAAYLVWRGRRLQMLPQPIVALVRQERRWQYPAETSRLVVSMTALLWALAAVSAWKDSRHYRLLDWILLVSAPLAATAAFVWWRARRVDASTAPLPHGS